MKPLFITLEGGEGAGKSTQARLLAEWLRGQGHSVVHTREPGGSPGAERLRGLLLSGEHDWSPDAETLLHFAARAEHAARIIRPALARGEWVVCDRFYDSTMAYQGYGQGADRARIAALIGLLGLTPDRTFMLDIGEAEAQRRMAARGLPPDRYDRLGAGFHARVAAGFRAIAAAEPDRCTIIDASGTHEIVHAAILAAPPPLEGGGPGGGAAIWRSQPGGRMTDPRENPLLFGHADAERELLTAMRGGRMHHAWLVTGTEGVGKATLSYRFARRLLAGHGESLALDAAHPVFRRVAMGSHADLLTIEREFDEKKKRMRGEIVVDDARTVSAFLRLTPAEGGWRVVVLDGAEHLNRNAANAVLKMLEEPPPQAVLLLTCAAPGRLLPTIRSRVRRLELQPLSDADMGQGLSAYLPAMASAERARIIGIAGGSLGRALSLADSGLPLATIAEEVLGAVPHIRPLRAFEIAEKLGGRAEDIFTPFMTLLRDGLSHAVRAAARGAPERLLQVRPLGEWVDLWQSLGQIQEETER